jgi:enoyl-CoA hydratase/carnithine racemase
MDATRCCIITGEGEKSFCAGGDIEAWSTWSPENFGLAWVRHGHRAFAALARLRVPLIAALNGHALGGGLELAVCADFRVAEPLVKFGLPETGLGIIPGWSGTQRAVRRFGSQTVRRMALLGEVFTAEDALRLGIVDAVAAKGESLAAARQMAAQLARRGPIATAITKMLINAAEGEDVERALETLAGLAVADGSELKTGVAAFREKRKPEFG